MTIHSLCLSNVNQKANVIENTLKVGPLKNWDFCDIWNVLQIFLKMYTVLLWPGPSHIKISQSSIHYF